MKSTSKSKGPWAHRFFVRFLTVAMAILVYWLLGFFVEDIRSIQGPDYQTIEPKYIDTNLTEKSASLEKQIADLTRQIETQTHKQQVLGDSSANLQQTINQLLELQKLGIQKNVSFSDTQQADFTNSLNLFLENQKTYQDLNQAISDLTDQKQQLAQVKKQTDDEIEKQRVPARDEYNSLTRKHNIRVASMQLAILLPILLIAAGLIIRKRTSIYFPLSLAFGAATLLKVTLVIHEYFPSKYFKYILILALLLVVIRLLVHFIKAIAFPKVQWLLQQYREAYEGFLCPVCEYPIRIGPLRFLFRTRGTVNRTVLSGDRAEQEEPYTCPSCGRSLFEECPSCHKIRHALLPHCMHCGAEKVIE